MTRVPAFVVIFACLGGVLAVVGWVTDRLLLGVGVGVAVGVVAQWVYLRALWTFRTAPARAEEEVA